MADLQTIREAIAGNLHALKANDTVVQVSAYLLDNPTPPSLMVAGVAEDGVDPLGYSDAGGVSWTILIEAALGRTSDIGSQKLLNKLLTPTGSTSLIAAVQADRKLTKRLSDAGVLTTGQAAAASDLAFAGYRGQVSFVLENGSRVLLATWAFTVIG